MPKFRINDHIVECVDAPEYQGTHSDLISHAWEGLLPVRGKKKPVPVIVYRYRSHLGELQANWDVGKIQGCACHPTEVK